ncbi:LEA type 2 family protein [Acidobacteriota bacterium]
MKPITGKRGILSSFVMLAALFALVLIMSCVGKKIRTPELSLEKIGLEGIHLTGMKINVHFDVINVNPYPITLKYMEYRLEVNGKKVGKGFVTEAYEFGDMQRQKVMSTLNVSFFKLPGAVKAVFDNKTVRAKVYGDFTILREGKRQELPFHSEADIPVFKN